MGGVFVKSRSLSDFRMWFDIENLEKLGFFIHYLAAKIVSAQAKCLFVISHGWEKCQFEQGRELLVGNGGLLL
jgi:hypothetical protein